MSNTDLDYTVYRIDGLPAGVFGESYVVCTGYKLSNDVFRGEWYILTQRPKEELNHGIIDVSSKGPPPELGVIDILFARAEALAQARINLLDLLEKRALEVKREELAYLPFDLKQIASPLLGCWIRGRFNAQLTQVECLTSAPNLTTHLRLMQQVHYSRRQG
jgi:hypothetical protein